MLTLDEKVIKAVVGPNSSETENKEASEGKYNLVFTGSEALFGSHRSTIFTKKKKIEAVFINEVHGVAKWFVLRFILFIFTLLESYQLYYFSFSYFSIVSS